MQNITEDIEINLIERSILGEANAQKQLYHRYASAMLNVAYRITKNEEDAKDILQDSFIKVFLQLQNLKRKEGFAAWIKRIVVNTSISHVKKKGLLIIDSTKEYKDIPEVEISQKELSLNDVKLALMQLPNGYRTVLSLYLIEGYDHQEISQILDISKSTSLTQYSRGKKKLIHLLQKKNQYGTH